MTTTAGARRAITRWEHLPPSVRRVLVRSRRWSHLSRPARPHVTTRLLGSVALITFDDGKVNAFSRPAVRLLADAHERVLANGNVRAVVLAGRPGQFSAGFDLDTLMIGGPQREELFRTGWDMLMRYLTLPLPVVVACTGNAVAAGAALLLAGDVRLAAAGDFAIGFNEAAIGLPLPGLLLSLAREQLAPDAFEEATAGARMYRPDEAVRAGFVDRLVAPSDAVDAAVAEAARLADLPAESMLIPKQALIERRSAEVRDHLQEDVELMRHLADRP